MTKKTHPAKVQEAINAARDISSDDNVNLQQAAEYLHGACSGYFGSVTDAAKAITGQDIAEAEAAEKRRLADEAEAAEKQRLADEAEAAEKQRLADEAEAAPPTE